MVADAAEIAEQVLGWVCVAAATAAVQEYQFCVTVAAGVAVHVPMAPVSSEPTLAVPVTLGATELIGSTSPTGPDATAAVEMDQRVSDPEVLVWVTAKEMNLPSCAVVGLKVRAVAPEMAEQAAGFADTAEATRAVHEYQACEAVAVGVAAQVPRRPVRGAPTCAVPVILGATLFVGKAAAAGSAGPDIAISAALRTAEIADFALLDPNIPMMQ